MVVENTINHLMRMNNLDVDKKNRPINAPIIRSVEVHCNPFNLINIRTCRDERERAVIEQNHLSCSDSTNNKSNIHVLSFEHMEDDQSLKPTKTWCNDKLHENHETNKRKQNHRPKIYLSNYMKNSSPHKWIECFKNTVRTLRIDSSNNICHGEHSLIYPKEINFVPNGYPTDSSFFGMGYEQIIIDNINSNMRGKIRNTSFATSKISDEKVICNSRAIFPQKHNCLNVDIEKRGVETMKKLDLFMKKLKST
jgi:hypothetical protein